MQKKALLLAALLVGAMAHAASAGTAPAPERSRSLFASVDVSEWRQPGWVSLNLETGKYEVTPSPPRSGANPKELTPATGTLSPDQLQEFRASEAAAAAEGLRARVCGEIVVSNAGPRTLILSSGLAAIPSERIGCWTPSGEKLFKMIEARFSSEAGF